MDNTFFLELIKESDRGSVLLGLAYLDTEFEKLLREYLQGDKKHLDSLLNYGGALGTLSSRISLMYSMYIITESEYKNMNTLRKIRNEFAHNHEINSFENQKIIDLISNLKYAENNQLKEKVILNIVHSIAYIKTRIVLFSLIKNNRVKRLDNNLPDGSGQASEE